MNYTHDDAHRPFFEAAYNILVEDAGAQKDPREKEAFVRAYTQIEHPTSEYRFQGVLGFGGKFWRNDGRFYVSCYREDRTKKLDKIIAKVNDRLQLLFAEHAPYG